MSKYLRKGMSLSGFLWQWFLISILDTWWKNWLSQSLTFTEKPMLPSPAAAFQNCTHQANLALGDPWTIKCGLFLHTLAHHQTSDHYQALKNPWDSSSTLHYLQNPLPALLLVLQSSPVKAQAKIRPRRLNPSRSSLTTQCCSSKCTAYKMIYH